VEGRKSVISHLVRWLSPHFHSFPKPPSWITPQGEFKSLKAALIVDEVTESCLAAECQINNITPDNYKEVLKSWQPDLLFVESAFHGSGGSWRYQLASQPRWLKQRKSRAIEPVLDCARDLGIPTVFWNKDDGLFFDSFIEVAKRFDHIFTTDLNSIPRYRELVPPEVTVQTMMMPYQPAFHSFNGFGFSLKKACFVGSYYKKILSQRRQTLDMMFKSALSSGLNIDVFDRNHDRLSHFFEFKFPESEALSIHPRVPHNETSRIYKAYRMSLNVNSVLDSETMCSRRLLEILACGGIAVTNRSLCVDKYFAPYCLVLDSEEKAKEIFGSLINGQTKSDLERAAEGARYVRSAHTWSHRLQSICETAHI
jgi:hypothetical protein